MWLGCPIQQTNKRLSLSLSSVSMFVSAPVPSVCACAADSAFGNIACLCEPNKVGTLLLQKINIW